MENKEAAFVCTQCGADVNFCDVDSVLGHPMPTFDDYGDVDGCYQCGPCQIKTEWALAHMAKQEADLMSSASHISALEAKCSDLERQLAEAQERGKVLLRAVIAVSDLINNSSGVDGLHLNGDTAPWGSLLEGGEFEEWLVDFSSALTLIPLKPEGADK